MIIVQLSGGLGNQMFQYAYALSLQYQSQQLVCISNSNYIYEPIRKYQLYHFNISLPLVAPHEENRILKKKNQLWYKFKDKILPYYKNIIVEEQWYHHDPNLLKIKHEAIVKGYFQSEKYFKDIEKNLRTEFQFVNPPSQENAELLRIIKNTPNAVSVHIRRGDFVGNLLHSTINEDFFKKALDILCSKISNLHLFVFSNDISWVQQNWHLDIPSTIVNLNDEDNCFEDLRLMSHCQHHIIANSSFSWWGAWLNPNPNKIVVAPSKWVNSQSEYYKNLNDIIPETWIKI